MQLVEVTLLHTNTTNKTFCWKTQTNFCITEKMLVAKIAQRSLIGNIIQLWTEAKFLDVIGTDVWRVFLLAIFTVTSANGFYGPGHSFTYVTVSCWFLISFVILVYCTGHFSWGHRDVVWCGKKTLLHWLPPPPGRRERDVFTLTGSPSHPTIYVTALSFPLPVAPSLWLKALGPGNAHGISCT